MKCFRDKAGIKKVNKYFLTLCALFSFGHAYAVDLLPHAKLAESAPTLKKGYVGAGISQQLLHGNFEWVNPYGIAYAKAGVFINDDHEAGGQIGFRFPYHFTGTDQNGYYFGVYAGHLESIELDSEAHTRLGVGVDLAYVMLNANRISTISVGIGAAEKVEGQYGGEKETEPQLQFAYSLSFGVF